RVPVTLTGRSGWLSPTHGSRGEIFVSRLSLPCVRSVTLAERSDASLLGVAVKRTLQGSLHQIPTERQQRTSGGDQPYTEPRGSVRCRDLGVHSFLALPLELEP